MKTIFKYLLFSLACIGGAVACSDDDAVVTPSQPDGKEAVLTIQDAPAKAEFDRGQTQTWTVKSENVKKIDITYPQGWNAVCSESLLLVIAPEKNVEPLETEGNVTITYSGQDGMEKSTSLAVALKADAPEPKPELSFELSYSDLTAVSVHLHVKPSNNELRYYYDICTLDALDKHNGDAGALVEGIITDFMERHSDISLSEVLNGMLSCGEDEDDVQNIPSDTELYFFAVGIDDNGKAFGTQAVEKFRTLPAGDPADCSFAFAFENLHSTSVSVVTIPSDVTVRYWTSIEEVGKWGGDAAMPTMVKETIEKYASEKGMTVEEVVKGVTFTGKHTDPWSDGIKPNTTYYAYAYAMDKDGNAVSKLFKERFKTPATDISEAAVKLTYRYFDGDMLNASDPDKFPADRKGKVLVQVKASPNEYTRNWVVALGVGDMTDPNVYPDESTKNAMVKGGQKDRKLQQYWVDGWKTCTLMAFGLDEVGIDGVLTRELVTLTKENASPIDQLAPIQTKACVSLSTIPAVLQYSCGIRMRTPELIDERSVSVGLFRF